MAVPNEGTTSLPSDASARYVVGLYRESDGKFYALRDDGNKNLLVALGNLEKAEDAAHSSGDKGVMALAVRNDSLAMLAGSNGDYIPLSTDELGNLCVRSVVTVLTNVEKDEDSAHTTGDKGIMALAVRADTATALAGTDGDYIPLIADANGRLHVNSAAVLTNLEKAEDAAHTTGDKGVMQLAVRKDSAAALAGTDGDYIPLIVDANGRLHVAPPARVATADSISAKLATDAIMDSTTALTPKFAKASVAASQTDSQVIAAVALKKLRVLALVLLPAETATTITVQSNATAISMPFANGANGSVVLPFSPVGWFETAAGEALKVTTGAGSATGIQVVYVEV